MQSSIAVAGVILLLQKQNTNGRSHVVRISRRREPPVSRIYLKHHNIVRILIRRQQKLSRRVQPEVARRFALNGAVLYSRELSAARVDIENRDRVGAPIRSV